MRKIENSPFVVTLHYIYETQNSLYLVLELLSGGEIFKIDNGKLSKQHAKYILYNLIKGIRDLRNHNIIHRDLKPDNIIFKYKDKDVLQNELKIVDFGLSSFTMSDTFLIHRKCGTPGFIAPEVINLQPDHTADRCENCDIFSVGMIFFFMLTGKIPYDGDDIYAIMKKNKAGVIDFNISELNGISSDCKDILLRMLDLDSTQRITPEETIHHPYFNDFQNYTKTISLKSLSCDFDNEKTDLSDEALDEFKDGEGIEKMMDTVNLAQNFNQMKERYKPTPSFQMKNSFHFNNNTDFRNPVDTNSDINSQADALRSHISYSVNASFDVSGGSRGGEKRITHIRKSTKNNQEIYRAVLKKNTQINEKKDNDNSVSQASQKDSSSSGKSSDKESLEQKKTEIIESINMIKKEITGTSSPHLYKQPSLLSKFANNH